MKQLDLSKQNLVQLSYTQISYFATQYELKWIFASGNKPYSMGIIYCSHLISA